MADATNPDQRFQLTTDGMGAYPYPIGNILGDRVDYAQLIKIYAQDTPEEQRRYSPAHLAEAIPTPVYGYPDEKLPTVGTRLELNLGAAASDGL